MMLSEHCSRRARRLGTSPPHLLGPCSTFRSLVRATVCGQRRITAHAHRLKPAPALEARSRQP